MSEGRRQTNFCLRFFDFSWRNKFIFLSLQYKLKSKGLVMETYSSEEIQKAIDKVRKLLALAGNNDSPAQIQAALMKVQELQAKYGFHVSELQSEEEVEVITVAKDSPDTKSLNSIYTSTASVLAGHFRVKVYIRTGSSSQLCIIGLSEDVAIFEEVLSFVYTAMRRLASQVVKRLEGTRSYKLQFKNTYYGAFLRGVSDALKANEESNALMVVTPDAVVKEYSQLSFVKSSSARMSVKDDYAQAQGYRDGKFVGGSYGKSGYLH